MLATPNKPDAGARGTMENHNTQQLEEALSVFIDDESNLTDEGLIDKICNDQRLISYWHSMHTIRDVLQDDYHGHLSSDFAAQVSAQIQREKETVVYLADIRASTAGTRESIAGKNHINNSRSRNFNAITAMYQDTAWWKPVAGFGLAASIAGAALLFTQLIKTEQTTATNSIAQVLPTEQIPLTNTTTPAQSLTLQTVASFDNSGTHWRVETKTPNHPDRDQKIEDRLNILLSNHLENATMGSVQGLVSHSRLVSYDVPSDAQNNPE